MKRKNILELTTELILSDHRTCHALHRQTVMNISKRHRRLSQYPPPQKEAEKFWSRGEGWELKTQKKGQRTNTQTERKDLAGEAEENYFREQQTDGWRTIERHTHKHTSTHTTGLSWKWCQWDKVLPSIYHIPSVFFSELVERDRGLRMILMVQLSLPSHTHHTCKHTHIKPRTHTPPSAVVWPRSSLVWSVPVRGSLLPSALG